MKVALITGASGAIGSATAELFLQNGFFVVGGYNSHKEKITALEEKYKDKFFGIKADFKREKEVLALYKFTEKSFGHVDALVLNVGKDLYKLLTDTTAEEWDEIFDVNVRSGFLLAKSCLPEMIKRQRGKIVFVSSVWGIAGASMETAYSASKAALIGLTRALSKEVAPSGVTVNCVCPGVIDSAMNGRFSETEMADVVANIPVGRVGKPQEIAEMIYYLCSERSDFITGREFSVDGGFGF